jgi:EmrB/QacA subfamily drug resistance transporter
MAVQARVFLGRRWWILATVLIGSLVGTLANSMAYVTVPAIMDEFKVSLNTAVWVVTIYVLLFSTLMPVCGRLGDMFGYKRIFLVGLSGMVITSALAATAPSIGWLIGWRALSGIFNAPTLPAIMAIIAQVFPINERGGAMGFWATINGAGHGLGPVFSGLLVQYFGWPAVYWFIGGLTLIGVVLILLVVPSDARRSSESFDLVGALTLTLATLLLMFNLTQTLEGEYGLAVNSGLWAGCGLLLATFVWWQLRAQRPFVDLRLFANRGYVVVTLVSGAQLFCLFGMQLLLPLYLIGVQGRTSGNAGLLIAPLAVTLALTSPLAGRLSDVVGGRVTSALGMGLAALAGLGLAFWRADSSAAIIVLTLVIVGFGMGMTQSPTANAVTLAVGHEKLGVALGIFHMLRFVAGTLGATLFGVIVHSGPGLGTDMLAFRLDFYLFALVAGAAALLALKMPGRPQARALRVEAGD